MTHFLFIENRGKTRLWQRVADVLFSRGHQITWLVQNRQFSPHKSVDQKIHILSLPPAPKAAQKCAIHLHESLRTDRGRIYFQAGSAHYAHYMTEIESVLKASVPDFVVGEATLFHELLTLDICRARHIRYVHPCGNRYPNGRFSIYEGDTQIPLAGSGEVWPESRVSELATRIAESREIPIYMDTEGRFGQILRAGRLFLGGLNVWVGRLRGDRFNTPSLLVKIGLQRRLSENLRRWKAMQGLPMNKKNTLLYALQMQPEANIDVWGRPYSDQVQVIREMLSFCPSDVQVAVKANPKSKYEVSDQLLKLAAQDPRVCLLPLEMSMSVAQSLTVGTLTVSGTVGLEAIFGKGRCLSLRHPIIESEFRHFHASSVADGVSRLLRDPLAGKGGRETGAHLIRLLVSQSYPGLISEPAYHPECTDHQNIKLVADALDGLTLGQG
jgi:hypothetical protein